MELSGVQAIPINVNGLITPVPLAQAAAGEVAALKSCFARQARDGCYVRLPDDSITRLDPGLLDSRLRLPYRRSRDRICELLANIIAPMATVARGFEAWGARVDNAALRVTGGTVMAGDSQINNAGQMHVDGSIMLSRQALGMNRITIRALLPTSHGAEVCDLSGSPDALSSYNLNGYQEGLGGECRKNGLTRVINDGEMMLMDMMTIHSAQVMRRKRRRVLVDCAVTLQLPDDWKRRVIQGRRPQITLG